MSKEFITLTVEDILELQTIQIDEFGGKKGLFKDTYERIDGILNQLYPIFGVENYLNIFEKVSAITYFLVKDHCFQDGNKRIALTVCSVLLYLNGYELDFTQEEAYKFIYEMASKEAEKVDFKKIIENNAKLLEKNIKRI